MAYCLGEMHRGCRWFDLPGGPAAWAEDGVGQSGSGSGEGSWRDRVGNRALAASAVLATAVLLFVGSSLVWAFSSRPNVAAEIGSSGNEPLSGQTPAIAAVSTAPAGALVSTVSPGATSASVAAVATVLPKATSNPTAAVTQPSGAAVRTVPSSPTPSSSARATPLSTIPVPVPTPSPVPVQRTHLVQPGETLWSVAASYGLTTDELARANGLADRNYIRSGQRLAIPQPSAAR